MTEQSFFDALLKAADATRVGMAVTFSEAGAPEQTHVNNSAAALFGCALSEAAEKVAALLGSGIDKDHASNGLRMVSTHQVFDGISCTVSFLSARSESLAADSESRQIQSQLLQSDRLAAVGTLAAGVAHEINNPLSYVMLSLEYLERELPKVCQNKAVLERLLERARDARHGVDRVATIVRDLRLFARPTEGVTGPVDLISVIEAAIRIARNEIRHYAELVRRYEPVPKVHANAARLEQVFLNLLVNATHAVRDRPKQGGRIEIHVQLDGPTDVVAEVHDNGPGMPQAVLDQIFVPFFTTKTEDMGTGLGLAICRSIVDSLQGTLSVQSEVGSGTTFRVRLPVQQAAISPPPQAPQPPPSRASLKTHRLLVIDDEPAMAKTLRLLVEGDYDVVACQSVAEGLKLLQSNERFDVILCDLMMPNLSGADLYDALQKQGRGLERRIVFMTAGAFGKRAETFVGSVDNPVLDKPFQLKKLAEALDWSLSKSQPTPAIDRG